MKNSTPPARCNDNQASGKRECTFPPGHSLRALTGALKARIPSSFRDYNPDTKVWRFWGGYEDLAASIVVRYHPDATVPGSKQSRTSPRSETTGSDSFAILHLRETAPVELIESAYRTLARLCHPDTGGDDLTMQRINGAYAQLKARVGA